MGEELIKTKEEYDKAVERIGELMDAEPGTPEGDELELLSILVDNYFKENFKLPTPTPIDVIRFYIEQRGLKARDNWEQQFANAIAKGHLPENDGDDFENK